MDPRMAVLPESPGPPGKKLSVQDLDRLPEPEEGTWYELFDGEVVVVRGAPGLRHGWVCTRLLHLIESHLLPSGRGEAFGPGPALVLDEHRMVRPDLQVVLREHFGIVREDAIRGVPDLVVEVLSPGTAMADFGDKRRLYEAHGVREYWIVDPEGEALLQLVLEGGTYRAAGLHSGEAVFRCAVLADLEVPLRQVWPTLPGPAG